MSYRDDNNWQILTEALDKKYRKEAEEKLDRDFKELVRYSDDNNLSIPLYNPRGDDDYQQTVYYLAEKNWERDGYKAPENGFTKISVRENKFTKGILK